MTKRTLAEQIRHSLQPIAKPFAALGE